LATLSLAQIRLRYVVEGRRLDAATEAALKADPRAGAIAILNAVAKRRFDNRSEGQRLRRGEGEASRREAEAKKTFGQG
jgi:ribonuclease HII